MIAFFRILQTRIVTGSIYGKCFGEVLLQEEDLAVVTYGPPHATVLI